jgi:hypothetical protein
VRPHQELFSSLAKGGPQRTGLVVMATPKKSVPDVLLAAWRISDLIGA